VLRRQYHPRVSNPSSAAEEKIMSKRIALCVSILPILLLCSVSLSFAQTQENFKMFSQLQFRYIGPVGNRTIAVVGIPGDPNVYYVGAASGGIFKTTDGGIH
jgi:hypothetical protein